MHIVHNPEFLTARSAIIDLFVLQEILLDQRMLMMAINLRGF